MLKPLLFIVLAAAFAFSCAKPPPTAPEAPAAKANEAWGFDFRIRVDPNLTEVPIDYLSMIRKAAMAWEVAIWDAGDVEHITMPSEGFQLTVTDDWKLSVPLPRIYLGWTDMEILVYVDDTIETVGEDEFQILAQTKFYATDGGVWLGSYMPIVLFGIAPATVEAINDGAMNHGQFYRLAVHELGHALGIGSHTLQRINKVSKTAVSCSYTGTNGALAFSIMKGRTYQSVPMEADCAHWDMFNVRWSGVADVMFSSWTNWNVPNDKLISLASLGVLDDLGFDVDYTEAHDTAIMWLDDPRRNGSAKPNAAPPLRCVPPRVMPAETIEWID